MLGHEPAFPYRLVLIAERKRERFPLSKPVLVPFLGPALGPRDFVFNSWAPKRYLKMEPKQCPKLDPNQDPKMQFQGANVVGRRKHGSLDIINQWSAQRSSSTVCSKPRTSTKEGTETIGRQICSNKEHVYVYRPNIVKT